MENAPKSDSPSPFLKPGEALAQFIAEEVIAEHGFTVAKSTIHEAYMRWASERPGRPAVSAKHLGMALHKAFPGAGEGIFTRVVDLPVMGAIRACRPFVWYGLRLVYPTPLDPFEYEHERELAGLPPLHGKSKKAAEPVEGASWEDD